jgi:hypothetical protein
MTNKLIKKILVCSSIFFISFSITSCNKLTDILFLDNPLTIDSIQLVDYPSIKLKLVKSGNALILQNNDKLPHLDSSKNLRLKFFCKNLKLISATQVLLAPLTTLVDNSKNWLVDIPLNLKQLQLLGNDGSTVGINIKFTALNFDLPRFTSFTIKMNPNGLTPLAGLVSYSSNQQVGFKYTIKGQDGEDYSHLIDSLQLNGTDALFGLYANYKNQVTLTLTNIEGSTRDTTVFINTPKLTSNLPDPSNFIVNKTPTSNAKGQFFVVFPFKTVQWSFQSPDPGGYPLIIDKFGKVRGFLDISYVLDMKPLPNGHYLYCNNVGNFHEIDLLGNYYHSISPPTNVHHDFDLLPNGNIIYTATNESLRGTIEDIIYEIDYKTGAIKNTFDLFNILDPYRPQLPGDLTGMSGVYDWFHNNSVFFDKRDNSILVSGRHQSAVVKIDVTTKTVKWILSDSTHWNEPYKSLLLKPTGPNFSYSYGQHSAIASPNSSNQFIIFDNGNLRSYFNPLDPVNNYSRLVEYTLDPASKKVTLSFEFGKQFGSANYTPALSNVDYITQDNMFICFGLIVKDKNGYAANIGKARDEGVPQIRLMEMDRAGNLNIDISIKNTDLTTPLNGIRTYRAHPIKFY